MSEFRVKFRHPEVALLSLPERLRQARESAGMTQRDFAKKLGAGLTSWQDYEAGRNMPGGQVFEALCRLGYSADWLLTGEGDMMRGGRGPSADYKPVDVALLTKALKMVRLGFKDAGVTPADDVYASVVAQGYAGIMEQRGAASLGKRSVG